MQKTGNPNTKKASPSWAGLFGAQSRHYDSRFPFVFLLALTTAFIRRISSPGRSSPADILERLLPFFWAAWAKMLNTWA